MEKTLSREWAYTLDRFSRASPGSRWLLRYRVSYFQQYINLKTFNRIAYNFLLNIYLFLTHAAWMFKGSLMQRSLDVRDKEIVFFLSRNITYLQHVVPVIKKYAGMGREYTILCPGAEYKSVRNFLLQSNADAGRLMPVERIGDKEFSALLKWLLFPLLFAADFIVLARLRLKNILWIPADFAKFSLVRYMYEKRIERWISKTGMLITATDHWMWESLLHEKAKACGIPNYLIQHGLVGDVYYPLIGSHICVWGDYYRNKMIEELGAEPAEVIVTGSGYLDELYHDFSKRKGEKKYVTFMSQPYVKTPLRMGPGIYQETVAWLNVLEPLLKKHHLTLLVKLHPRDRQAFYPQLTNCLFTKNPLPEVLSQTRLALTVDSTSIVEASLFNLPVIQLYNPGFYRFYDLSKSGLSIKVKSREELLEMIANLLGSERAFRQAVEKTKQGQKHHFYRLGSSLEYFDETIRAAWEAGIKMKKRGDSPGSRP